MYLTQEQRADCSEGDSAWQSVTPQLCLRHGPRAEGARQQWMLQEEEEHGVGDRGSLVFDSRGEM